jgi:Arc/MetJ family transcription regulator
MRTTITIDDTLYDDAVKAAGEENTSALVAKALQTLVTVEASKRILALSGKAPNFSVAPRSKRAVAKQKNPYRSK